MEIDALIYVGGHRGLVGSALVRRLQTEGASNLIPRTSGELDLTDQSATNAFFASERPDYVFLAAAKVGGIHADATYPAEFIRDNLAIQSNVIHSAWKHGVRKLLLLGSSCIHPKHAAQPMREDALLTGPLEPTNEPYAIAKIAGLKMCHAYRAQYGFDAISAMPSNLYGPGDNYHPENSHVVAALIQRLHDARRDSAPQVLIWGTCRPVRELMKVDDLADALLLLMRHYGHEEIVNVGSGQEISIADLARIIAKLVGYEGDLRFDLGKPDGAPRKRLDLSRLERLGWSAKIGLAEGISATYRGFMACRTDART